MNPIIIVLALSVAGNALLGWQWLHARDVATQALSMRDQAQDAAGLCSKGVADMQARAKAQAARAAPARAAAAAGAASAAARADQILSSPASVPGDDCRSAQDQIRTWLQGRAQ